MGEIAKFIDNGKNFALPVKAHFTSKPVLPGFYQFLTIQIINPSYVSSFCCWFKTIFALSLTFSSGSAWCAEWVANQFGLRDIRQGFEETDQSEFF